MIGLLRRALGRHDDPFVKACQDAAKSLQEARAANETVALKASTAIELLLKRMREAEESAAQRQKGGK